MYLVIEADCITKYLLIDVGGPYKRSVRTSRPRVKYFPVRPDQTQSTSIISYDHYLLKIRKICFNLNMTR